MEVIVCAPSYDENSGGTIALHKLCDLLVSAGIKSSIFPLIEVQEISPLNWVDATRYAIVQGVNLERQFRERGYFKLCSRYRTQLFEGPINRIFNSDQIVVVYPEIVFGNPLNAKHVARWLLHDPGFHSGKVYYSKGEVQFRYNDRTSPIIAEYLQIAEDNLFVADSPLDLYHVDEVHERTVVRSGSAYTIRKGRGRRLVHDLDNSICIDGMNHDQVATIFKTVKFFYSYDLMTFYSNFAAFAGAISVLLPLSPGDPDQGPITPVALKGVAYGIDDIPRALSTVEDLRREMLKSNEDSLRSVRQFIAYWSSKVSTG